MLDGRGGCKKGRFDVARLLLAVARCSSLLDAHSHNYGGQGEEGVALKGLGLDKRDGCFSFLAGGTGHALLCGLF